MILKSTTSIHLLIYPSSDLHYLLPERKHPPSFHCIYFNPFFIQMPEEVLQDTNQIPTLTCLKSSTALKINLKSFNFFREAFINAHSACCVDWILFPKLPQWYSLVCVRIDHFFHHDFCEDRRKNTLSVKFKP